MAVSTLNACVIASPDCRAQVRCVGAKGAKRLAAIPFRRIGNEWNTRDRLTFNSS
jgi:hypothetical protein